VSFIVAAMAAHTTNITQPVKHTPSRVRARPFRVTDRDLELLRFIAAHRFVLACQVSVWFGTDRAVAYRRLSGLVGVGLLSYTRVFHAKPGCYRVTNGGLAVIDSRLPRPAIDLRTYGHDVGVVSLALESLAGRFGAAETIVSEREMRSTDQRDDGAHDSHAIALLGYDRYGHQRRHYPDLVVELSDGGRVAIELELSMKGRRRLEDILAGYGAQHGLIVVVYVTTRPAIAGRVRALASSLGLERLVRVDYRASVDVHDTGGCRAPWQEVGR
jgi:hypothetical protein